MCFPSQKRFPALWPLCGLFVLKTVDNSTGGENGLPLVTNDTATPDLTIRGNGATVQRSTVSGTPDFRVLVNAGANVAFNGLSFAHGKTDGAGNSRVGAGIYNVGTLTLTGCTISNNDGHCGGLGTTAAALALHRISIDHEKLTCQYGGRNYRLTDVSATVIQPILA